MSLKYEPPKQTVTGVAKGVSKVTYILTEANTIVVDGVVSMVKPKP